MDEERVAGHYGTRGQGMAVLHGGLQPRLLQAGREAMVSVVVRFMCQRGRLTEGRFCLNTILVVAVKEFFMCD